MSRSYTQSNTTTFTLTHAKKLASKLATDLKRIQRFYNEPSDAWINAYEEEITQFLKGGYVDRVIYGFKRNGWFIEPTLQYSDEDLRGASASDDFPGRIPPRKDVNGAVFTSFLVYSQAWGELSPTERSTFKKSLPFTRSVGSEPGLNGYFESDKTYSAGGRALNRRSLRS